MARFDVYRNPGRHSATTPYLVDVQGNHLDGIATRVVIPLLRVDTYPTVGLPTDLTPVFVVDGVECTLDTPNLGAVPRAILTRPVASLAYRQDEVFAALDRLFGGW